VEISEEEVFSVLVAVVDVSLVDATVEEVPVVLVSVDTVEVSEL